MALSSGRAIAFHNTIENTLEEAILSELARIRDRFDELTMEMGQPDIATDYERMNALAKERSELSTLVELYSAYEGAVAASDSARAMLEEDDAEMRELAQAELAESEERIQELTTQVMRELLPKDPRDQRNVIMEIRAGTGGEEAALFASDLYRMYSRYAERRRWQTEILNLSESEKGGMK
jgi:peptide chain release factor 1